MPRTAQLTMRGGFGQMRRGFGELSDAIRRWVLPVLGAALVLASLLLLLALATYDPRDPSFSTATAAVPRNYAGHHGATVADLLIQGIGIAAYLIPIVLLGWAFHLMLQRPIRHPLRKLLLVPVLLLLGAEACSILQPPGTALPGTGGVIGWLLLGTVERVGLGAIEVPLAMAAAALVAWLLLSIIGLSPGDWRDLGPRVDAAVLFFDEQPVVLAFAGLALHPHQHPAALELFAP